HSSPSSAAGVGTGTLRTLAQPGHFMALPARAALTCNFFLQPSQVTVISSAAGADAGGFGLAGAVAVAAACAGALAEPASAATAAGSGARALNTRLHLGHLIDLPRCSSATRILPWHAEHAMTTGMVHLNRRRTRRSRRARLGGIRPALTTLASRD